ncbi:MAG: T9SS type A sorting domain-containing protein [bacterium]|nr:T9SS type A sorting domain-containing protein [bacterium]
MKKIITLVAYFLGAASLQAQSLTFTITNLSGTNSITCTTPTINLSAAGTASSSISFSFVSATASLTGANVGITSPGSYTITASAAGYNNVTQVLSIYINTLTPTATVSPLTQSFVCNGTPPLVTGTATPGTYITHSILIPFGGAFASTAPNFSYSPLVPGTYTYMVTENTSGCKYLGSFTVTSPSGYPTYSLTSPQSFTVGCGTKSVVTINITNASTSPPGGPITYTLVGPPATSVFPPALPTGPLSNISTYTLAVPGTWVAVVRDNISTCNTFAVFSVLQNTNGPNISASLPTQVLDCNTSSITMVGLSTTNNVSYEWRFPGAPGVVTGSIMNVAANFVIPTSTLVANFTLVVTDNSSTCKSTSIIPMYQNVFPPKAVISYGGADPCITSSVVLTNASVSGIPTNVFPITLPVVAYSWMGPAPQASAALVSTYLALTPGVYTLNVQDLNNGCKSSTTTAICTGISENKYLSNSISIYPNPGNGLFTISIENSGFNQVEVYNTLGGLIWNQTSEKSQAKIDLQNEPAGVYFVSIKSGELLLKTFKIIKQ